MSSTTEHTDAINARILAVSEDKIQGFVREPFARIAELSGLSEDLVLERIRSMLAAGTIRRVRQTLLATSLAQGALVAWKVPPDRLDTAFDFMFRQDPFPVMSLSGPPIRTQQEASTGYGLRLKYLKALA